ncbi:unannotated protein [freshwater metagenome]|uniref:Unannotated protein n=1 Tax=freshwater metagenome TaxID=449393 RepID=A0A6J5ZY71_9ZZZZ|nr:DUF3662 domain-containing protein [Actinomycetota bacterium]MSX12536.1 DUF3662 domain-containing protein [Actinomycetota bacterium]
MSVLRNLEQRLSGLVEGTFGRVFRTEVGPVEISRRITREMDQNVKVSLSRSYAPNEFVIWLSPEDRVRYDGVEDEVADELAGHLLEHARAERLTMVSRPVIEFGVDEALGLGEFGIETRVVKLDELPAEEPQRPPPVQPREPAAAAPGRAIFEAEGTRFTISPAGAVIGRSSSCDVVLANPDVSRQHAQIAYDEVDGWIVEDLGSTNGVIVNGGRVDGSLRLTSGDQLTLGPVSGRFEAR